MKTYRQFQENVATYVLGKTARNILPKLMVGAGLAGTLFQSKKGDKGDVNITPRNLKNLENAVFRDKKGRKLDGEILKRREQKIKMKGPFADTPNPEELRKAKLTGKSPLTKAEKKNRKLSAQREMIQRRDNELMTKGPGDPVPGAKRAYLKKLLNRLKNNLKPSNGLNENESKNPYLDSKGRDKGGVYGQNPPIPKGFPRDIMDSDNVELKNKYFRRKDVMDYFRNQGNKIKQTFETSEGPITKEYSNPFVNQKASQSKRLPAG